MHRQIAGRLTGRATKWIVVGLWIIALALSLPFAQKLADAQNNEMASWLPESAESTAALGQLRSFVDENDLPTTAVYHRESGLTPSDIAAISAQKPALATIAGAKGEPVGPMVSPDGKVAQLTMTFNFGTEAFKKLPDSVEALDNAITLPGVATYVAGQGGQGADSAEAFQGIESTLLFAAAGVVILVLLLTYRSPVMWVLPLISAVVAYFVAQAAVYAAVQLADVTVNGQSQSILTVLVFGAGTDYALLLVARYREELRRHQDRHEAMAFALHRATPAVIASAMTVVLGMLCLMFADLNSTAGLGPVAAIGVAATLLVSITLLPALLVVVGRWVFWPKIPAFGSPEPTATGWWSKVGRFIAKRPRQVWVGTTIALGVACLGLLSIQAYGIATEDAYTKPMDSLTGQQLLNDHGLADTSNPVMVVAAPETAPAVAEAMRTIPEISPPTPPVSNGTTALITAQLHGDAASPDSFEVIENVRRAVHAVPNANALVGGNTATFLDMEEAAQRDNKVVMPLVLAVVLLILMVLLRAILAPVLLILTVVLSFGAAMGLSWLVFDHVFGFPGMDASLPLMIFVFLVALGIDYNIFLMSRVREETPLRGTRQATLVALSSTGAVITSAGLVLACTFLVMATLPFVSLVEVGVAVALGVMLDTMIVRSVLVTALNLDLGERIWWPSRIDNGGQQQSLPSMVGSEHPTMARD